MLNQLASLLLDESLSAKKHAGLVAIANLAAGLINSGRAEEANKLISHALSKVQHQPAQQEQKQVYGKTSNTKKGLFYVLETRLTTNGNVRAYCLAEDEQSKVVIYAKNGVGKALEANAGGSNWLQIEYCEGDKGLIAKHVQVM